MLITFDTVLNRLREDVPIGQVTVSGEELNDVKKLLSFYRKNLLHIITLKKKNLIPLQNYTCSKPEVDERWR